MQYQREHTTATPGVRFAIVAILTALALTPAVRAQDEVKQAGSSADEKTRADKLVELKLKLPKPAFKGTPKHVPPGTNLEPPRKGPREPFMAPPGVKPISEGKPVSSSDSEPIIGEIKFVTDGKREATEGGYVELGPGVQWVQIDLREPQRIYAIMVWHYHASARVYHDVVIQVADDPDFITNVRTVYNNDHDNSAGLGLGEEKEYWETYEGRLIDAKGVTARYVRLYSNGSTEDDQNHYTEVEVYGLPAK
jgi:hypothetical protein